jgi:hypothetical protein
VRICKGVVGWSGGLNAVFNTSHSSTTYAIFLWQNGREDLRMFDWLQPRTMKGFIPMFCVILLTIFPFALTHSRSSSPLPSITSSPRVNWDVHACPLGFVQVSTGTGCRRRRRPAEYLDRAAVGYDVLQTTQTTKLSTPHQVHTTPMGALLTIWFSFMVRFIIYDMWCQSVMSVDCWNFSYMWIEVLFYDWVHS